MESDGCLLKLAEVIQALFENNIPYWGRNLNSCITTAFSSVLFVKLILLVLSKTDKAHANARKHKVAVYVDDRSVNVMPNPLAANLPFTGWLALVIIVAELSVGN